MENVDKLKAHLKKCKGIINKGYTSTRDSGKPWLNKFCAEFLTFTRGLHDYIATELSRDAQEGNAHIDTIFLCLTQIVTCVKHMERTIKAEDTGGMAISASRQHFLDRIHWCLERLYLALRNLAANPNRKQQQPQHQLEENTFVDLMDLVLDYLAPYSSYQEESVLVANVAEENAEAMFASKQIRATIDLVLSHTLAFANVALKDDKKAMSALCQKVLRECIAFQEECALNQPAAKSFDRKLKAVSLETALYQLEDYINEALLRLVYTCFLDFQKFSIEKLRTVMRVSDPDDPALDELIADFDVNVDRTTQIGIFAIAFAPNAKIKTVLRSCLASFESLDSCIIPSLQTNASDIHAELLEQHFNEEVANFKGAIQEIIDSHAFAACYSEMLAQCLTLAAKQFDKTALQELTEMGEFLYEHFQLPVNHKELRADADRLALHAKFVLMLRECQAILKCADQIEPQRILKRFKIFRSVLRKFLDALQSQPSSGHGADRAQRNRSQVFIMSDELSDSQRMFASIGISPSIRSILYRNERTPLRQRAASDSLKANYSQLASPTPTPTPTLLGSSAAAAATAQAQAAVPQVRRCAAVDGGGRCAASASQSTVRGSVRRKESLRTAMFKRQKSTETEKIYHIYRSNSASLQISDILDQLTDLSASFSTPTPHADAIGHHEPQQDSSFHF